MKTPHLDNVINDLKGYNKNDMLTDIGKNQLKEYEAIKKRLEETDVVNQRELLFDFLDYWKEKMGGSFTTDVLERSINQYLESK